MFNLATQPFGPTKGEYYRQSFILPKDKIANFDNMKARLRELATYLKIKYETDEKWEWK